MKKLDDDIGEQIHRVNALRNAPFYAPSTDHPSIDVETMKLKRLIDKRSQLFEEVSQILDKYNDTAKSAIDKINR